MSLESQPNHGDVGRAVDLGVLMALAYGQFVQELRSYLTDEGFDDLGRSDGYVFRALDTAALTTSELADRLRISKQGAGQIVADMQRRGYVGPGEPDPDDGRARRLRLAARGEEALAAARRFHQRYERRLRRRYGGRRVDGLRQLLVAMAGAGGPIDPDLRGLYL
jgi:DNA-binding MarR family transcriptional regulator